MATHRIFACEAQPVAVEGLAKVLASTGDLHLEGSASNPAETLTLVARMQPNLILIDQAAGLRQVFSLLTALKVAAPQARAVLWIVELAEVECFRALQLGACGIVRRTLPVASLLDCLRTVAGGSLWVENPAGGETPEFMDGRGTARLTPRELDIVRSVRQGMKNKEIAGVLSITPGTVKVHLMHIFEKTGVKDRFELAVQAPKLLGWDREEGIAAIQSYE